jgi:hypothetical protein
MQALSREQMLNETLTEMHSSEPEGFQDSDLASCDMIDHDADHTIGMWKITYDTSQK